MVHVELLSIDEEASRGRDPTLQAAGWLSLGLPNHMVLVSPTSLKIERPCLRSQIVLCMSLVPVVYSDCCCHMVLSRRRVALRQ
jgi:hypothetical protein